MASRTLSQQRRWLMNKYGVSLGDLEEILLAQGLQCPICETPMRMLDGVANVDHDHSTGYVRGVLCGSCNRGLGNFKDNVEFIERAALYLHEAKANSEAYTI